MKSWVNRLIASRFLVFLIVGGFNTLFGYALFAVLFRVGQLHYNVALLMAYSVGVFLSFATHKRFTYEHTYQKSRDTAAGFMKYVSTYIALFGVNVVLLSVLVQVWALDPLLGQIIAIVVITLLTFVIQKYWVFKRKDDR